MSGNSSDIFLMTKSPSGEASIISKSFPTNSDINCRHAPQGGVGLFDVLPTMAIASNSFLPSEIAFANAVLSAQIPTVNEAFSILHPVITVPSLHNSAAPTWYLDYGEYELFLASFAIAIKSLAFLIIF